VIHALALLPVHVKLRIVGYETIGHAGYLRQLKLLAKTLGVDDRLHDVPAVPRRELLQWCARSDVGLALLPLSSADVNERRMVGASNKPFDYLSQGAALLVNQSDEWVRTFVEPGLAVACDPTSPRSIADAAKRLVKNRSLVRTMGERGRQ